MILDLFPLVGKVDLGGPQGPVALSCGLLDSAPLLTHPQVDGSVSMHLTWQEQVDLV